MFNLTLMGINNQRCHNCMVSPQPRSVFSWKSKIYRFDVTLKLKELCLYCVGNSFIDFLAADFQTIIPVFIRPPCGFCFEDVRERRGQPEACDAELEGNLNAVFCEEHPSGEHSGSLTDVHMFPKLNNKNKRRNI